MGKYFAASYPAQERPTPGSILICLFSLGFSSLGSFPFYEIRTKTHDLNTTELKHVKQDLMNWLENCLLKINN